MPATKARTGPLAITWLSTKTISGLKGQQSQPQQFPSASYQTVAALVGESFEAIVGQVTVFAPLATATALPVSSVLPPPTAMTTSAPACRAIWVTRATSALLDSPANRTSIASRPASFRLVRSVAPTNCLTQASQSTSGFLPSRRTYPPASASTPRPWTYFRGAISTAFIENPPVEWFGCPDPIDTLGMGRELFASLARRAGDRKHRPS